MLFDMKRHLLIHIFSLAFLVDALACSPKEEHVSGILIENLEKNVKIISSAEFEGRLFSTEGEKKAAGYILQEINKVEGPQAFMQPFTVEFDTLIEFQIKNKHAALSSKKDFNTWEWCFLKDTQNVELVLLGFGIDLQNYSDFENVDIKNKLVVMELNSPLNPLGLLDDTFDFNDILNETQIQKKTDLARKSGALGIVFRIEKKYVQNAICSNLKNDRMPHTFNRYRPVGSKLWNDILGTYPIILADEEILDSLFSLDTQEYEKELLSALKTRQPISGKYKTTVDLVKSFKVQLFPSQNVLCVIEGQQKEAIVISAHYDHLGKKGDSIYFGANDNGSGIAALIELAKTFKRASIKGFKPEKTIIFMACSGEEIAFFGSEYFLKSEIAKNYKIIENVNIDCIGRADSFHLTNPNFTYVFFKNDSLDVNKRKIETLNTNSQLSIDFVDRYPEEYFDRRSDHFSFYSAGIPTIFFFTGLAPSSITDYHTFYDTHEKLNYSNMVNVTDLVFKLIWNDARMQKVY